MVDKKAVNRPLCIADTSYRAVKAVAKPIDNKAQRRYPKIIDVDVSQDKPTAQITAPATPRYVNMSDVTQPGKR